MPDQVVGVSETVEPMAVGIRPGAIFLLGQGGPTYAGLEERLDVVVCASFCAQACEYAWSPQTAQAP